LIPAATTSLPTPSAGIEAILKTLSAVIGGGPSLGWIEVVKQSSPAHR
jgi:hypothetical protein